MAFGRLCINQANVKAAVVVAQLVVEQVGSSPHAEQPPRMIKDTYKVNLRGAPGSCLDARGLGGKKNVRGGKKKNEVSCE